MSNRENNNMMNNYLAELRNLSTVAINLSNYLQTTSRDMTRIVINSIDENRYTDFQSTTRSSNPFNFDYTRGFNNSTNLNNTTSFFPRRTSNTRSPPLPLRSRSRLGNNRNIIRENDENNEEVVFTGLLDLTPVSVYPSITQIMNATEMKTFDEIENPLNSSCPITMDSFEPSERVCQIKHCKHIFKERSLYTWFSSNIGCPVCRFDIREDSSNRETPNENYATSVTTTGPPIPERLMTDITQLLTESISRNVSNSTNV